MLHHFKWLLDDDSTRSLLHLVLLAAVWARGEFIRMIGRRETTAAILACSFPQCGHQCEGVEKNVGVNSSSTSARA